MTIRIVKGGAVTKARLSLQAYNLTRLIDLQKQQINMFRIKTYAAYDLFLAICGDQWNDVVRRG